MLRISLLEFFLRGIPESLLLILAINSLLKRNIRNNKKIYIADTLILSVSKYLIRLLPIHFGVHTILNITVYILIFVIIDRIEINKAISYSLFLTVVFLLCEFINLSVLNLVFRNGINDILNNKVLKVILFYPSLIMFLGVVVFIYKFNKNRQDICS